MRAGLLSLAVPVGPTTPPLRRRALRVWSLPSPCPLTLAKSAIRPMRSGGYRRPNRDSPLRKVVYRMCRPIATLIVTYIEIALSRHAQSLLVARWSAGLVFLGTYRLRQGRTMG